MFAAGKVFWKYFLKISCCVRSSFLNSSTTAFLCCKFFSKIQCQVFKTKNFEAILKAVETKILKDERRDVLVISESKNDKLKYSARNLPGVTMINLENINIVDLLKSRYLVTTEAAIKNLETQYSK